MASTETMTGRPGASRRTLAAYGAFGGILPTVVRLFQLMDEPATLRAQLTGLMSLDVLLLTLVYVGSAALVASVFPFRKPTPWSAIAVGVGMPALVGALSAAGARLAASGGVWRDDGPAGAVPSVGARLLDLLALF